MVVGKPIEESSHKTVRDKTSDEEDSSNDSGILIRRKGKKMMSSQPFPKIQTKALQGVKIIDLEYSNRIPLPSVVSSSIVR